MNSGESGQKAIVRALQVLRRQITLFSIVTCSRAVTFLLPPQYWYPLAFRLSDAIARVSGRVRFYIHDPSLRGRLLSRFLDHLSLSGRLFPIPLRIEGDELLVEAAARPGGFLVCSAHVPLAKLIATAVRTRLGNALPVAVAVKYVRPDRTIDVWGDFPVAAIRADGSMLLHTRALLRKSGCLMLLVDREQGDVIPTSIFRFVGRMRACIVTAFTYLEADGTVLVRFRRAPGAECRTEEDVQANMDFIAAEVERIRVGDSAPIRARRTLPIWKPDPDRARHREAERIQLYTCAQLTVRIDRLTAQLQRKQAAGGAEAGSGASAAAGMLEERLALMMMERESRCTDRR